MGVFREPRLRAVFKVEALTMAAKTEYKHNIFKSNKQCKEIGCTKNETIYYIGLPLQSIILPWELRPITHKYACTNKK
jgi:hypothetical protein